MMNQGPDAITAAAAIAVLMAPHPVAAYTLTHTQEPTTTSSYVLLSFIASESVVGHLNPSPPHPEQGGQRITLYWQAGCIGVIPSTTHY